jgi:diaminopimelate decarboxylase
VRLPELAVGDSLCIMDAGAYFVPFATSFSYPQPAIVAIDGDRAFLVRQAERFEGMAARDVLPESVRA